MLSLQAGSQPLLHAAAGAAAVWVLHGPEGGLAPQEEQTALAHGFAPASLGARVLRANVYERRPVAPAPRAVAALRALDAPAWLLLSSGEALEHVLATLPENALARLREARVVAASERLAELARGHGLPVAAVAASARPADMLAACTGVAAKP